MEYIKMNSLPSISRPKDIEFEEQWNIIKETFKSTNLNMEVLMRITQGMVQIMKSGGYGSLFLEVEDNYIKNVVTKISDLFDGYLTRSKPLAEPNMQVRVGFIQRLDISEKKE